MVEMIVVRSKLKEVVGDFNMSSDVADSLNEIAISEIKKASKRAEENGRKTVQAKDVFPGEIKSQTMLVVKSKVKEHVGDMNVSGDFSDALNEILTRTILEASQRTEANGRKTVQARDL